jgi:mRNA interferase RelE/StbE
LTPRYRVEISAAATRQLASLQPAFQVRIKAKVLALADNPRPPGAAKIVGTRASWRIRIGDHRVIYEVQDEVLLVLVIKVGHRRQVYQR